VTKPFSNPIPELNDDGFGKSIDRKSLYQDAQSERNRVCDNVNKSSEFAASHLMLINSVLISGSFLFFVDSGKLLALSTLLRCFVFGGFILLVMAMWFSVINAATTVSFFDKWARMQDDHVRRIEKCEVEKLNKLLSILNGEQELMPNRTSNKWMYFQIICLCLSSVAYVLFALGSLFELG
jgi:hypothetical protein